MITSTQIDSKKTGTSLDGLSEEPLPPKYLKYVLDGGVPCGGSTRELAKRLNP